MEQKATKEYVCMFIFTQNHRTYAKVGRDAELTHVLGTHPVPCVLGVQDAGCRAGQYMGLTRHHPI
eukprot:587353-Ditylum_brightwellii.AAC.1